MEVEASYELLFLPLETYLTGKEGGTLECSQSLPLFSVKLSDPAKISITCNTVAQGSANHALAVVIGSP